MSLKAWLEHNFRQGTWLDRASGGLLVFVILFCLSAVNIAYMSWRLSHDINTRFSPQIFINTLYVGAPVAAAAVALVAIYMNKLSLRHTWFLLWLCLISWVLLRLQATQWVRLGEFPGTTIAHAANAFDLFRVLIFLSPIIVVAVFRLWQPMALWMCLAIGFCFSASVRLESNALESFGITLSSAPLIDTGLLIIWKALDVLVYQLNLAAVCLIAHRLATRARRFRLVAGVFLSLLFAGLYLTLWFLVTAGNLSAYPLTEMALRDWSFVALIAVGLYLMLSAQDYQHSERDIAERLEMIDQRLIETRLQVLQAQLEPHFLFNTLADVKRLYQTAPQDGRTMLNSLLDYLKIALPKLRSASATLGDELDLVSAYLAILQQRMGDRLRVSFDATQALRALPFPSMMVLTLVENAVKHGLMPLPQGGAIHIRAYAEDDELRLSVADTGLGFGKAPSAGTGVGLANVRERLRAQFGADARLELHAQNPHGVTALIAFEINALSRDQNPKPQLTVHDTGAHEPTLEPKSHLPIPLHAPNIAH